MDDFMILCSGWFMIFIVFSCQNRVHFGRLRSLFQRFCISRLFRLFASTTFPRPQLSSVYKIARQHLGWIECPCFIDTRQRVGYAEAILPGLCLFRICPADGIADELCRILQIKLLLDVGAMGIHCFDAEVQLKGDVARAVALP